MSRPCEIHPSIASDDKSGAVSVPFFCATAAPVSFSRADSARSMPARVKVFTGWDNDRAVRTDPAYARRPMVLNAANHSPSAKVFLGTTIAAGTPGAAAMPDGAGHHRQPPQRRPLHRPAADPAARHQQPQRCLRGPGGCRVRQQRQRHAGRPEGRDQGRAAGRRRPPSACCSAPCLREPRQRPRRPDSPTFTRPWSGTIPPGRR